MRLLSSLAVMGDGGSNVCEWLQWSHWPLEPAVNVHGYGALVVIQLVILTDETCSEG